MITLDYWKKTDWRWFWCILFMSGFWKRKNWLICKRKACVTRADDCDMSGRSCCGLSSQWRILSFFKWPHRWGWQHPGEDSSANSHQLGYDLTVNWHPYVWDVTGTSCWFHGFFNQPLRPKISASRRLASPDFISSSWCWDNCWLHESFFTSYPWGLHPKLWQVCWKT